MSSSSSPQHIIVYLIERHPLDLPETGPVFRWLEFDNDFRKELEDLIGPFDRQDLTMLVDEEPGGPEWQRMLEDLIEERVSMVVTHLAPLSPAQRQQLIGVCAQTGAQLITPSDAGRNRALENEG